MDNEEQNKSNLKPIQLPELVVYGKKPLPWYLRAWNGITKFVNDEIFLNKNNIRVKNALKHPKIMDAVQEGGNIAAAVITAPVAAYGALLAAPVIIPTLKVTGQAMTPSTWIGGISKATGYTVPNWFLNTADIAASSYFANEARKDVKENGLNWLNGINAVLSLAPMTRDTEAIEGVANGIRSIANDFRTTRRSNNLGRVFNKSVKDTLIINVPIEHVSNKGITEGAGLNPYSTSDVGFHFSPIGSKTTTSILKATGAPFIRTGVWTYSNNTKPTFTLDKGNWTYSFNPDLYKGLEPGTTPSENVFALNLRNPNYSYVNNFESLGNTSYMTTTPNFGLLLSKNTTNNLSRIDWDAPYTTVPEGIKLPDGTYNKSIDQYSVDYLESYFRPEDIRYDRYTTQNNIPVSVTIYSLNGREYKISKFPDAYIVETPEGGKLFPYIKDPDNIFSSLIEQRKALKRALQYILDSRDTWIESLSDESTKDIVRRSLLAPRYKSDQSKLIDNSKVSKYIKNTVLSDIDDVYLSDDYITRFIESMEKDSNNAFNRDYIRNQLKLDLTHTKDTNFPIFYYSKDSGELGVSNKDHRTYGINANAEDFSTDALNSTIFHEFGHNLYGQDTFMGKYIRNYTENLLKDNPIEYTELGLDRLRNNGFFVAYISRPTEFRQRIMEGVRYGIKEDLTPEEIYNECNIEGFVTLKKYILKDYLIKMLGSMLGTIPIILNTKNNDKFT